MKRLKIAFGILLCITILSVGASVVCAVIAGNVAESFRDYRSSVITTLSSLHGQLNSSKQAFTDALARLDGLQKEDEPMESDTQSTAPESTAPETESESQSIKQPEAAPESTAPAVMFTAREVNGRIGIFDASGALVRTLTVPVVTLPRADREQLSAGIALASQAELDALIADYEG